jgi:hypothetical protein
MMKLLCRFTALPLLAALTLSASTITVPPGLQPGDTYRIILYTSSHHDGASTEIDVYNAFVSSVAAGVPELAALGTTWKVLGSTATVSALSNAGLDPIDTSTPFYNTRGQWVATGTSGPGIGLYAGDLTSHGAPITDEQGNLYIDLALTGTRPDGLASTPLGSDHPTLGAYFLTDSRWTATGNNLNANTVPFSFMAVSGELTVPGGAPEPGSLFLMGAGAVLLAASRLRRRRTRPSTPSPK